VIIFALSLQEAPSKIAHMWHNFFGEKVKNRTMFFCNIKRYISATYFKDLYSTDFISYGR
jgi:hypothetical protein